MFTGILDKALASISTQDRAAIRADWVAIQFNTGIDLETIRNMRWSQEIGQLVKVYSTG